MQKQKLSSIIENVQSNEKLIAVGSYYLNEKTFSDEKSYIQNFVIYVVPESFFPTFSKQEDKVIAYIEEEPVVAILKDILIVSNQRTNLFMNNIPKNYYDKRPKLDEFYSNSQSKWKEMNSDLEIFTGIARDKSGIIDFISKEKEKQTKTTISFPLIIGNTKILDSNGNHYDVTTKPITSIDEISNLFYNGLINKHEKGTVIAAYLDLQRKGCFYDIISKSSSIK